MYNELYETIGTIAKRQFPDATPADHINKLKEEADEILNNPDDIMEYADCLFATFAAAYKSNITFAALEHALIKKTYINASRKWEKTETGTYQHTEDITIK